MNSNHSVYFCADIYGTKCFEIETKELRYVCLMTGRLKKKYLTKTYKTMDENKDNSYEGEEEDKPFNVGDIVKRAKLALNMKFDSDLAKYLGVSRSTLCNWVARNSIDFSLLLSRMINRVDYNWLLTGKGTPVHENRFCNSELARGEVEILHHARSVEAMGERSVTLYDISAAANLKTILTEGSQRVLGQIVIPNIPRCDGAVYVSGDSMYPILKAGDIVGFKFINSFEDIIYGEMYLVSFERGGDEYLSVKYINKSEEKDCVKLVSYNQHHDPMDLPVSAINALGIVKFSIRKNMIM